MRRYLLLIVFSVLAIGCDSQFASMDDLAGLWQLQNATIDEHVYIDEARYVDYTFSTVRNCYHIFELEVDSFDKNILSLDASIDLPDLFSDSVTTIESRLIYRVALDGDELELEATTTGRSATYRRVGSTLPVLDPECDDN